MAEELQDGWLIDEAIFRSLEQESRHGIDVVYGNEQGLRTTA